MTARAAPNSTSERTRTAFRSFIHTFALALPSFVHSPLRLYGNRYRCRSHFVFRKTIVFCCVISVVFPRVCYGTPEPNRSTRVSVCRRGPRTRISIYEKTRTHSRRACCCPGPRASRPRASSLLPAPHALARYPLPKAERVGASKRRPRVLLHASRIVHPPLVSRARLALPGPTRDSGASACKANASQPSPLLSHIFARAARQPPPTWVHLANKVHTNQISRSATTEEAHNP